MTVVRRRRVDGGTVIELIDAEGAPVPAVSEFLGCLAARGCSPNTLIAYAYDLQHLWRFLATQKRAWQDFRPSDSLGLLQHLRATPCSRRVQRLGPWLAGGTTVASPRLAPATINRVLAAVSSFFSWAILSERLDHLNPVQQVVDQASMRVSDRHRPFLDGIARGPAVHRTVRARTVRRVPRPLSPAQVAALFAELRSARDLALLRLMLDGGLRPGEALGVHLDDVAYGRRRVVVRYREDHPKGARAKSRTERVVDLHEPMTLEAVNRYVMDERPREAESPYLFLVGGCGLRRCEPLGYAALAKLFARACERAAIHEPWVTPHALRHTHATQMWEGGMRELALQRRLGHASPESTRVYTRISDPAVVAEYRRALGIDSGDRGAVATRNSER